MANVTCECGSIFPLDKVKNMDKCPVRGKPFFGDDDSPDAAPKETTKWYYYEEKGVETLTDVLYNQAPLYTFDAVDHADARRQLKEVFPDCPLLKPVPVQEDTVRCPKCGSTQIQMVPRKYSLLTGFATNRMDRVCVKCMKRF